MKRTRALVLALVFLMLCPHALAEHNPLQGTVEAGDTLLLTTSSGGIIDRLMLEAGMYVSSGDEMLVFRKTRIYAPEDATVTSVLKKTGESASGTVLTMDPKEKYTLTGSTGYAYSKSTNEVLHVGERLLLICTIDGTHQGYGVVTGIEGKTFTLRAVAGEFFTGEAVRVYRGDKAVAEKRVGRATVERTAPTTEEANGLIVRMFASEGDRVNAGDALFDVAEGAKVASLNCETGGIVTEVLVSEGASVQEGDAIARITDESTYLIACPVTESALTSLEVGTTEASVVFSIDPMEIVYSALLVSVSSVGEVNEDGETFYTARFSLRSRPDLLRLGMTAEITY